MKFVFPEKKRIFRVIIWFILILFFRFQGIFWGEGFFFHPDEGNMARSVAQMKFSDLNPRFFAYGQFPLYLSFFSGKLLNFLKGEFLLPVPFSQAVYWLRFYSVLFSLGTIVLGYWLSKKLLPFFKNHYLLPLWLIFTPGLIQTAHFGTTESLLSFVALGLVYFSLLIFQKGIKFSYVLTSSFLMGIGLASKVSSALFFFPLGLAFWSQFKKEKKKLNWVKKGAVFVLLALFFFALFCPFYFLNWREALRIVRYEAELAAGLPVFYTRQFLGTKPLLFQFQKIFPWVLGWPIFILGLVGGVLNFYQLLRKKISFEWGLFYSSWLPWFFLNSFLFTKWVRFIVPILPFWLVLAVWLVSRIKNKRFYYFLVGTALFPGIVFSKIYWTEDIRVRTMKWLNQNLTSGSVIVYEGGNIVDLPGLNQEKFTTLGINFYELEEKRENRLKLEEALAGADYFLSLSRRIFLNHQKDNFPYTAGFYENLFSGKLGFIKIKEFKVFSDWEELIIGSDLKTEETWTVFDHPTIRLYKKVRK